MLREKMIFIHYLKKDLNQQWICLSSVLSVSIFNFVWLLGKMLKINPTIDEKKYINKILFSGFALFGILD